MAFITHQFECSMRPKDKEPAWASAYDDLFDQYIDTDHFNFDHTPIVKNHSEDRSISLFAPSGESIEDCRLGKSGHYVALEEDADSFWARTLRSLEEKAALSSKEVENTSPYPVTGAHRGSNIYNPDFLSLGGHPSPHLVSPPASPGVDRGRQARPQITYRSPSKPRGTSGSVQKTIKKTKSTPNMMSPSRYRAGFQDLWTTKIGTAAATHDINLPIRNTPLSPPPSGRVYQGSDIAAFPSFADAESGAFQNVPDYDEELSPLSTHFQGTHIHTPQQSPRRRSNLHQRYNNTFNNLQNIFNFQQPFLNDTQGWEPSWNTQANTNFYDNFPLAPELSADYNPWSAPSRSTSQHNPWSATSRSTSQHNPFMPHPAAPMMPLAPNTLTIDPQLANSGLSLHCDPFLVPFTSGGPYSAPLDAIPPVPPISPYYLAAGNVYVAPPTPRRRRASTPRSSTSADSPRTTSRAPSHSRGDSRSRTRTRSRAPSGQQQRSGRGQSQSRQQQHRRARSSTSRSAVRSASGGGGGFVNLTPADSGKLLTGVAPSGSSKTKARRDKEAADKRQRLSVAAVRAVVEAGGDVASLRAAGLVG